MTKRFNYCIVPILVQLIVMCVLHRPRDSGYYLNLHMVVEGVRC